MPGRADYTPEEWELLMMAPEMVGIGALSVSRSGPVGKLRGLMAFRACLNERTTPETFRRIHIIQDILEDIRLRAREPLALFTTHGAPSFLLTRIIVGFMASQGVMLKYSQTVAELLAKRAPFDEAWVFKRWLMWIARRVAGASGDSWLGSGAKISPEENAMLNQLETSLQLVVDIAASTPAEFVIPADEPVMPPDDFAGADDGHQ